METRGSTIGFRIATMFLRATLFWTGLIRNLLFCLTTESRTPFAAKTWLELGAHFTPALLNESTRGLNRAKYYTRMARQAQSGEGSVRISKYDFGSDRRIWASRIRFFECFTGIGRESSIRRIQ